MARSATPSLQAPHAVQFGDINVRDPMGGLATNHPHLLYWFAAGEVAVFVVLGGVLMARSVGAGVLIMAMGLGCGGISAIPAVWSERHPDQARVAVQQRRDRQTRMAQRHPAYFLVVVPIFAAVDASLRWNTFHHHRSALSWTIPAGGGLLLGAVLGGFLVIRARRAQRDASPLPRSA